MLIGLENSHLIFFSCFCPPELARHRELFACFDFVASILPVQFGGRESYLSLLGESPVSRNFAEIRLVHFPVGHGEILKNKIACLNLW